MLFFAPHRLPPSNQKVIYVEEASMKQVLVSAAFAAAVFSTGVSAVNAEEDERASGYLARSIIGDTLEKDYNIGILGWAEASLSANDNDSRSVSPQGFFLTEEGLQLNQAGLMLCRGDGCPPFHFGPKHNVLSRIGPTPAPKSEEFDIGFNVTAIYGTDSQFLRTAGFDDFSFDTDDENKLSIPQWFLDIYLPVLDGSTLMVGSFQTPLENDIGYPFTPPNWFVTHTYAFQHGPAKHVGGLYQVKIPTPAEFGLLSLEGGIVQGWNNLIDENNDFDYIAGVRWRSPDMRTWVDLEAIYGNGENDAPGPALGGSPYVAISTTGEYLDRFAGYVVASHAFTDKFSAAVEATYGYQEGGDAGLILQDSEWYGVNVGARYSFMDTVSANGRVEVFRDDDAAHVLWGGVDATVYSATAGLDWQANKFFRIRPEVRYDTTDDDQLLFGEGQEDSQLLGVLDVVVTF